MENNDIVLEHLVALRNEIKEFRQETRQETREVLQIINRISYSLAELMAQCDLESPPPEDAKAWSEMERVGKEII